MSPARRNWLLAGAWLALGLALPFAIKAPGLYLAARRGDLEEATRLLEAGAKVDGANVFGVTPLMAALKSRQRGMAKFLIARGADTCLKSMARNSALDYAARSGDKELLGKILKIRRGSYCAARTADDLTTGASQRDPLILKMLLAGHGRVDNADPGGEVPICVAAAKGQLKHIALLFRAGASPNAQDHKGRTGLLRAAKKCKYAAARWLLEAGADPNRADHGGATPLMEAARNGDLKMANLLLRYNADPRLQNRSERDALSMAQPRNCGGVYELLAKRKDLLDWRQKRKETKKKRSRPAARNSD